MTQTPRKTRTEARQDRPAAPGGEAMVAGAATGAILLGVLAPGKLTAGTDDNGGADRIPEAGFGGTGERRDQQAEAIDVKADPDGGTQAATGARAGSASGSDAPAEIPDGGQITAVRPDDQRESGQEAIAPTVPADGAGADAPPGEVTEAAGAPSTAPVAAQEAPSGTVTDLGELASRISQAVTASTETALSTVTTDWGTSADQSTSGLLDQVAALSGLSEGITDVLASPVESSLLLEGMDLSEPVAGLTVPDGTSIADTLDTTTDGIRTELDAVTGTLAATIDALPPLSSPEIAPVTEIANPPDLVDTPLDLAAEVLGPASGTLATIPPDAGSTEGSVTEGLQAAKAVSVAPVPDDPIAADAIPEVILGAVGTAGETSFLSNVFYDDGQSNGPSSMAGAVSPDLAGASIGATGLLAEIPLVGTSYTDGGETGYDSSGLHLGGVFA